MDTPIVTPTVLAPPAELLVQKAPVDPVEVSVQASIAAAEKDKEFLRLRQELRKLESEFKLNSEALLKAAGFTDESYAAKVALHTKAAQALLIKKVSKLPDPPAISKEDLKADLDAGLTGKAIAAKRKLSTATVANYKGWYSLKSPKK